MLVSASFLSSKTDSKTTIAELEKTNCDYIHVDYMDGVFVKEKNLSDYEIKDLLSNSIKPLDVHLMSVNPLKELDTYEKLNTAYITFHYEINLNIDEVIKKIKEKGCKVGISIKPETDVTAIVPYLNDIDLVLIMSVEPGKGGQEFIEDSLLKISVLKKLKLNYHYLISVDGGINDKTIMLVKEAGVDMVVAGSYICKSDDYNTSINRLKNC